MLKTYITAVPLQGRQGLKKVVYQSDASSELLETRFPIIQVIHDTLREGDTAKVLVIRQKNDDTAENYKFLLEELAEQGIPETQVQQIALPENQNPETMVSLCRDLVDAIPQITRAYACITFGTKPISVITMTALSCAESTHTELEVGGIHYGEIRRNNGQFEGARLYDMTAVYHLSGLVNGIHDSKTAEEVFRQLVWMSEHKKEKKQL